MEITHLTVDNGLYSENVANVIVKRIYDVVTNVNFVQGELKGTIIVEHAVPSRKAYLENRFRDLHITMTGEAYIDNDDSATLDALAALGDGAGLTIAAAVLVTSVNNRFSQKGCVDASFFQYFIGLSGQNPTDYAFSSCSQLETVILPTTLPNIGTSMFANCSSLEEITIPSTVTSIGASAFTNCTSITSIEIPSGVTSIGDNAFNGCTSLETITIPSSVTSIGVDAFTGTPWYDNQLDGVIYVGVVVIGYKGTMPFNTSITLQQGTVTINPNVFRGKTTLVDITIPSSVTTIGSSAFQGCTGLTSITIPNLVTRLETALFSGCTGLTSVTLSSSLESIGAQAFYNCSSLMNLNIPSGVTDLGLGAFCNSTISGTLTIPGSVKSIRGTSNESQVGVFRQCTINSLVLGEGVERIEDGNNTVYSQTQHITSPFQDVTITNLTIPSTLNYIGTYCFYISNQSSFSNRKYITNLYISDLSAWCNITFGDNYSNPLRTTEHFYLNGVEITALTIPNDVTSISKYAFQGCPITSLNIPEGVTSIGEAAFNSCGGLTSVTIPSSITSIGSSAFYNCTGLTSVTVLKETPVSITSNVFYGATNATLYVPHGCSAAYQAANNWKNFASIIELPEE